ncbi:hypothetical protein FA13DRAFT_1714687 [Coprinellus micaceus]|uniref:Uncharacterized protein n=1 Tax=Coprinellus micaceus TaxID=71717 RepID=A0A4Y7SRV3_COPMI|nr:hypothetical protein FA13DRAFT_1714687 [Coprinellus micaceus]
MGWRCMVTKMLTSELSVVAARSIGVDLSLYASIASSLPYQSNVQGFPEPWGAGRGGTLRAVELMCRCQVCWVETFNVSFSLTQATQKHLPFRESGLGVGSPRQSQRHAYVQSALILLREFWRNLIAIWRHSLLLGFYGKRFKATFNYMRGDICVWSAQNQVVGSSGDSKLSCDPIRMLYRRTRASSGDGDGRSGAGLFCANTYFTSSDVCGKIGCEAPSAVHRVKAQQTSAWGLGLCLGHSTVDQHSPAWAIQYSWSVPLMRVLRARCKTRTQPQPTNTQRQHSNSLGGGMGIIHVCSNKTRVRRGNVDVLYCNFKHRLAHSNVKFH